MFDLSLTTRALQYREPLRSNTLNQDNVLHVVAGLRAISIIAIRHAVVG